MPEKPRFIISIAALLLSIVLLTGTANVAKPARHKQPLVDTYQPH
jgi:hypothetical protein